MPKIVPIVEGQGEVEAVPALLLKLLWEMNRHDVQVGSPRNAHGCGNLTSPGGLEKFIQHCWKERDCGAILVLMDADEECPLEIARGFSERVQAMGAKHPVVTVIAKCEYEAWFLASLEKIAGEELQGRAGLPAELMYPGDVEARVGVKGWLSQQFPEGRIYKETLDQKPMTERLDTALARERSRSFRRLWHAVEQVLTAIDDDQVVVSP